MTSKPKSSIKCSCTYNKLLKVGYKPNEIKHSKACIIRKPKQLKLILAI